MNKMIIAIILLFSTTCYAAGTGGGTGGCGSAAAGGDASLLIDESWEGSFPPSGWTANNGDTTQFSSAGLSMEGSFVLRQLESAGSPTMKYTLAADKAELWFKIQYRQNALPSEAGDLFVIYAANGTTKLACFWEDASGYLFTSQGSVDSSGHYASAANTTYDIWGHYKAGTGSNGIMEMFVDTTSTKPGSPSATVTAGDATGSARVLDVQVGHLMSMAVYWDHTKIYDASTNWSIW